MCLVQGHKSVPSVRLETETPQSRVKCFTTEPLLSQDVKVILPFSYQSGHRHLISPLLMFFFANNMDPDQTATKGAV